MIEYKKTKEYLRRMRQDAFGCSAFGTSTPGTQTIQDQKWNKTQTNHKLAVLQNEWLSTGMTHFRSVHGMSCSPKFPG